MPAVTFLSALLPSIVVNHRYRGYVWTRSMDSVEDLLEAHNGRCLSPKALKIVEATLFGSEQVNDHIIEVEEHPSGPGVALAAPHLDAVVCQALI
jgi:hypothetical protein